MSAMHDFGTVSHISDATTLHSSKFPVQACWRCLLKNSATLVRSDQTPVEQANATRNVANGSMLKDQKNTGEAQGRALCMAEISCSGVLEMPSKKFRHFGTISSGPNCSFAGTVKHRSSNTIRGIAGTRNVANRSVLKDKKNSQGRAHTCMRDQSSLCSSKFPVQAWWRNSAFWHDLFRSKPESGVQTQQMQPEAMQGPGLLQMGPC